MTERIFGYTWAEIQRAQQGGRLIADPPRATAEADLAAARAGLAEHGAAGLASLGYHGWLDMLRRAGDL